ncbi:hypothetical protein [Flavobacterium hungaricum]|uniref:Lipoprotein n=1 Tax=Flavobacterium hungaricum TaxID=2082725 RepID=A0ABR9TR61_9FLAO|nr:hypothetical protein [Flavobacterium hungaricum]MBE8727816.1 hypothetical protein [Flavobacterium hungaricum]
MKTFFKLIVLSLLFAACNQNTKSEIENTKEKDTVSKTEKTVSEPAATITEQQNQNKDLEELSAIELLKPQSKNVFKKYGIEFTGNCYACDLAVLSITKKQIKMTNVCNDQVTQEDEIIEFSESDNVVQFKTKRNNFTLTKIDKAPVYELKITGDTTKIKDLRISKYYTTHQMLDKFEEHDCGDFQG